MTFTVDELLLVLAWEARVVELQDVCAALGLTRREVVDLEFAAIDAGAQLAVARLAPRDADDGREVA